MPPGPANTQQADGNVRLAGVLRRLERATLYAEAPVRRAVGSNRLNPLPHAGTISVFLLIVVTITGLYLTLFFEFGFEDSFRSVTKMEDHPIQRTIRAVHRYSSAALVVTVVVHAFRTFVMARFTGPRRFRWLTGSLALVLVWLAGVTGYWLIWDVRASSAVEATANLAGSISAGWELEMLTASGSGWLVLLVIWFSHLVLTAVIGWATWRHLRPSSQRWLPPRRWMWVMGGVLVATSIFLPAGMLRAADPATVPADMPLDPFVMFLLPPLLSPWPWLTVMATVGIIGLVAAIPWLLRRTDPPIAEIVEPRCTGCELCVIDCPYLALTMSGDGENAVAVVDPERCVGCGICVGSCSFEAIIGLGAPDLAVEIPSGLTSAVTVACERHLRLSSLPSDLPVVAVTCTGVLNPRALSALVQGGVDDVRVIGCNPGDCTYGVGNLLTSERLSGERNPHLARGHTSAVTEDWATPGELANVIAAPGSHPAADLDSAPVERWALVPAVLVVAASVVAIGLATDLPYASASDGATVRVAVDHVSGATLAGQDSPSGGEPALLEVRADGAAVVSRAVSVENGTISGIIDLEVPEVNGQVEVTLVEGDAISILYSGTTTLGAGQRLLVEAIDTGPEPGAVAGRELFESSGFGANLGCEICHSTAPGANGVGPSLAGVGLAAGDRVPGIGAEEYLRESILDPDAYVVEGYPSGQMLPVYAERLTDDEVDALVAYLLTLGGQP